MPIEINVDPINKVATRTLLPPILEIELVQNVREMLDHPQYEKGMSILWDSRQIQFGDITLDTVGSLEILYGESVEERGAGGFAIVVGSEAGKGLVEYVRASNPDAGFPIKPFEDYEEAFRWCKDNARVES